MAELEWVGKPHGVMKGLGQVIAHICKEQPDNTYVILRKGPEVETEEEYYTHEVKSRIYCKYYYKEYYQ